MSSKSFKIQYEHLCFLLWKSYWSINDNCHKSDASLNSYSLPNIFTTFPWCIVDYLVFRCFAGNDPVYDPWDATNCHLNYLIDKFVVGWLVGSSYFGMKIFFTFIIKKNWIIFPCDIVVRIFRKVPSVKEYAQQKPSPFAERSTIIVKAARDPWEAFLQVSFITLVQN